MNVSVYLPDDVEARAREEGLKLSRICRDAVERELERREKLKADLGDVETYDFELENEDGLSFIGRITGQLIAGDKDNGLFLTSDKRYYLSDSHEEVSESEAHKFVELLKEDDPGDYIRACHKLGLKPVIDLPWIER